MPAVAVLDLDNALLLPLYPAEAAKHRVRLAGNQSLLRGTILAEKAGTPGRFVAYRGPGYQDGTSLARLILEHDCFTDANGLIQPFTLTDGGGPFVNPVTEVYAFTAGTFPCSELVGLDAQAVAQLGRLLTGSPQNGILRLH